MSDYVRREPETPACFIVGCGRSGTTLLYEMLCLHPDTAWFSTLTDRLTSPLPAGLSRTYHKHRERHRSTRFLPMPSEGYALWDDIVARPKDDGILQQEDVNLVNATKLRRHIKGHMRLQGGKLFVNKNTRNTRRVMLLRELFPDAQFIHVIRHPLDTVSSLLNVAWWPTMALWTHGGAAVAEVEAGGTSGAGLAAELWTREVRLALDAEPVLGQQVRVVRYEELVADAAAHVGPLLEWLGLQAPDGFLHAISKLPSPRSIGAYKSRLSGQQVEEASAIVGPMAGELGYSL